MASAHMRANEAARALTDLIVEYSETSLVSLNVMAYQGPKSCETETQILITLTQNSSKGGRSDTSLALTWDNYIASCLVT